jgi:hypothetical protein
LGLVKPKKPELKKCSGFFIDKMKLLRETWFSHRGPLALGSKMLSLAQQRPLKIAKNQFLGSVAKN